MRASISDIIASINGGTRNMNVNGIEGSAGAWLAARIHEACRSRTVLIVTSNADRARELCDDIKVFLNPDEADEVILFPASDVLPYLQLSPEPRLWADRMRTLYDLSHGARRLIVAPVTACLRVVPPKLFVANSARVIRAGSEIDRSDLSLWLAEMGYTDTGLVEDEGEFAVRGGILDLWAPTTAAPVRIELEGDKIVSMRAFDPATQRSQGDVREVTVIPVRDVPFSKESVRLAVNAVTRLAEDSDLPVGEKRHIIEMLNEHIAFAGIESFMPLFHGTTSSFADYLPADTLVISDDPLAVSHGAASYWDSIADLAAHTTSVERLVPPSRLYLSIERWDHDVSKFKLMTWNALSDTSLVVQTSSNANLRPVTQGPKSSDDPLAPVISLLRERQSAGQKIVLTCHTKVQAERLSDLFRWHGLPLTEFDAPFDRLKELSATAFRLKLVRLTKGFNWPDERISIVTDEELFGSKVARRPKERSAIDHFTSFSEMTDGDHVVHEQHGIGRYRGLKNLTIQRTNSDFIILEYLGGDKLYLPVYRLNLLQRYVGPGDAPPFLDKLGGTRWDKAQKQARRDILTIAKDLLKIYAEREVFAGFPFPASETSFEEFSAAFPYDETPDQERAIEDVVRDMEVEKPMDRLVCGDVGYGKTEVAMRAAFKAASAGKQTAVLVPTTLLAFQHFESFTKRFAATPVRIEMLSRFRSKKEQTSIIEELRRGTVDIVIGTHRLLQKDVEFRDLGLLVIDEEQRFGVAHKEKIRKLKATVDCLTLTATPIPRTLHLSLTGIRDISVIDTPPMDRLSISTQIVPFDDSVIRYAINTELARDGEVFFVHNRVETIRSMEAHLKELVPGAKIAVAHGQMDEQELEDVMTKFVKKEFNVLLTTSIIESGLDIPSANTIIVNRADTFGLAQLYQIRGRVGRSSVRAYAYLLIPQDGVITDVAKKRLTVLQRFTELGSGFQIAMHDLEIRGSGNILGRAQSGHVAAIGYEMYTKLLNREIRKLQGKVIEEEIDPEIHLPISALFTESYIADAGTRIDLYKRLASRESEQEVADMGTEIADRFGPLPPEAMCLIGVMAIKVLAKKLKIVQFSFDGRSFACQLDKSNPLDLQQVMELVEKEGNRYRLRPPDRIIYVTPGFEDPNDMISEGKNFLRTLAGCVSQPPG